MRFFIITCLLGLFAPAFTAMALGIDELPPETQKLYAKDTLDPVQPVGVSAYRDWKPKKGPPWL